MTPSPKAIASPPLRSKWIRWARRIAIGTIAVVLALVAGAALFTWIYLRRSLPETSGSLRVAGLAASVRIVRDEMGIPTIIAGSRDDAYVALGYVHAQDRFFQMETERRIGQGRLSELVGGAGLETDKRMRTLGLYRAAERAVQSLSADARRALDSYARGVNAWLDDNRGRLPPELGILRLAGASVEPEPWRPADSAVWGKVIAYSISYNHEEELLRAGIIDKVGIERAGALFPPYPAGAPIITAQTAASTPSGDPDRLGSRLGSRFGSLLGSPARELAAMADSGISGPGSNSWVVGPSRTRSGKPILANDPHLAIQSPNVFYLVRLVAPGLDVGGASFPGIPGVILGRNPRIAWGATNLGPDTQDLFQLTLDPAAPDHYLIGATRTPFLKRAESIRVAGRKEPVVLDVRDTVYGPVLVDDWRGKGPLALRWAGLDPSDTTIQAFLEMNQAQSWSEFRTAASHLVAPAQNLVYADVEGHIGYTASGRIPNRRPGQGTIPQDGSAEGAGWNGYIPFEELPSVFDPPEGFIVAANNKVVSDTYQHHLPNLSDPYRAARIRDLIIARSPLTLADVEAMHADQYSLLARDLVPLLRETPTHSDRGREAVELLRGWDQVERPDSAAGALFVTWYHQLLDALVADDLGSDLYRKYVGNRPTVLVRILGDRLEAWCDDQRTPGLETCADLLEHTLERSLEELSASQGRTLRDWRLDRTQSARFVNAVGSQVPLIGSMFVHEIPVGGDMSTIRVSNAPYATPHDVRLIQSYVGEYDLAPGGETRVVIPMGQSGHPLSDHYNDLLDPWRRATTVPMVMHEEPKGRQLHLTP